MLRGVRRRPVHLAVAVGLALLLPPAAPVAAEVTDPPDPGVVRPRPAPGAVVGDGEVTVEVLLHARAGVASPELAVNGEAWRADVERVGDTTWRLRGRRALSAGRYVAEASFTDGDGRTARRTWEFTTSAVGLHRLAGDDRVATSVAISRDLFGEDGSAPAAVLARAGDFADALAGAPAAAEVGGPLLLTPSDRLDEDVAVELRRVLRPDATVHLLGGTLALTAAVGEAVHDLGFAVRRHAGDDRYATAAAVLEVVPESSTAVVASGRSFPDALAASAPAARDGTPILLTEPDRLPPSVATALDGRAFDTVYVVGGPAVVHEEVLEAIGARAGQVVRVAGADRYATAAAVASRFHGPQVGRVAIASGERFPDALAGGPHAGRHDVPLLLSPATGLARPQIDQIAGWGIAGGWLYGGEGALEGRVAGDARRAVVDGPGPRERWLEPPPGEEVNSLETVVIELGEEVDVPASSVHVEVDGREVRGTVAQGDFPSEVVFRAAGLPFDPAPNEAYPGHVWALVRDGDRVRHLEWTFTLRTLEVSRGDVGPTVGDLQERLTGLGYWLGTADGTYGALTTQAVMAFQKHEGLPRTGSVDEATRERLAVAQRPTARHPRSGRTVEIDKTRQVMLFVLDGRVEWIMNTSTGTEDHYWQDGRRKLAHTPEGTFTFSRQIDGMRDAPLGRLWRPKYFTSAGHAIHGSTSVPAHPASHGCARLSYPAIDFVWSAGLAPLGTTLFVYR